MSDQKSELVNSEAFELKQNESRELDVKSESPSDIKEEFDTRLNFDDLVSYLCKVYPQYEADIIRKCAMDASGNPMLATEYINNLELNMDVLVKKIMLFDSLIKYINNAYVLLEHKPLIRSADNIQNAISRIIQADSNMKNVFIQYQRNNSPISDVYVGEKPVGLSKLQSKLFDLKMELECSKAAYNLADVLGLEGDYNKAMEMVKTRQYDITDTVNADCEKIFD
jgi:hypothetical protein